MSADLWIETVKCKWCGGHGRGGDMNLTYNLSPMVQAAGLPKWDDLVGMKARKVAKIIKKCVDELLKNPEKYRAMNPENGWGNYDIAVRVLSRFAADCAVAPRGSTIGGWL